MKVPKWMSVGLLGEDATVVHIMSIFRERLQELRIASRSGNLSEATIPYLSECAAMKQVLLALVESDGRLKMPFLNLVHEVNEVSNEVSRIYDSIAQRIDLEIIADPLMGSVAYQSGDIIVPSRFGTDQWYFVFDFDSKKCSGCHSYHVDFKLKSKTGFSDFEEALKVADSKVLNRSLVSVHGSEPYLLETAVLTIVEKKYIKMFS